MTTLDTKHFKSLLVDSTTGILVVSSERIIQEVNPYLCDMFGYESHELVGHSVEILHISDEYYEKFGSCFKAVLLGNDPLVQIEFQFRRKDGTLFWAMVSGIRSQLLDRTNGVVWGVINITARKLAETALRESELKFRTVAEYMYDWEYWRAPDGSLAYCSPSCERITGFTAGEFLNNPELLSSIIHPDDRQQFAHHLDCEAHNSSTADCQQTNDFRICTRNGEERWITHVCQQVFDQHGTHLGRRASNRDITRRKQAEENLLRLNRQLNDANEEMGIINSELELRRQEAEETQQKLQQLSSAVVNSPVSIVITDIFGRIEYVNPKFTDITGYLVEEAIGQNPSILNAGIQPKEFYQDLWETILAGQEWSGNLCNRKKNGEMYWEHASISPIKDQQGAITHFVAIKEDVTEEKRITEELQVARDAADAANRSKSEFLANMSHEIRTPLNAIIGFSSLALKSDLLPHQQEYIGKIHTAGEFLLNIINDVLDFSKIEARKLQLEQISFRPAIVLANAASMVQQKASDKGLQVRIEISPELPSCLIGDPHRLVQIITNLLSNAVKFTHQGEVVLSISLLIQDNDRIQLACSVQDTGIGIPPEQLTRLFDPFTQADGSTTRRYGGTGLGLSISKQLVELMGGEIWCESVPEQGSSFNFTAWFKIGQAHDLKNCPANVQSNKHKEQSFSFSGCLILLVEDNELNQQLTMELLKETGAILHLAVNGKDAVEMIATGSCQYDMVLMDIQMPVMDGFEATRLIRVDNRFTSLPIIAMTANARREDQQQILQAGMNAFLAKPIDAHVMLQTMALFLQPKQTDEPSGEPPETDLDDQTIIPVIDGLNSTEALSLLGDDKKLYLWILKSFIKNKADAAHDIREALNAGDTAMAVRCAHTVKGLAGNMGALKLEQLAQTLEQGIARNDSFADIKMALEAFAAELERLITTLKNDLPPTIITDYET